MADRAEFIEAIRHRTRTGKYKPTHAPDIAWTPKVEPPERERIEDPPARFLQELEALGGHGLRVESTREAREYVISLAKEWDAKLLVRWDVEELETLGVDELLRAAGIEVAVDLGGVVDLDAERVRLSSKIDELEAEIQRATKKLANESFVGRAPAEVVEKERQKLEEHTAAKSKVETQLAALGE